MRIPIASALAWPQRMATPCAPLDLASIARLDFEATDEGRFPATALCRAAIAEGGARPAQLNAANEVSSEERRVGKECVSTLKYRWTPSPRNKKKANEQQYISSVINYAEI